MTQDTTSPATVTDAEIKRTTEGPSSPQQRFAQGAQGMFDQLGQKFGPLGERARQLQQEYGQKASEQVRARPMAAIGAAVVVGVVLSKLLGGRR
jgi:ElaB/YqjD/DUF883 family membrane-anchored ribosome-binding protein